MSHFSLSFRIWFTAQLFYLLLNCTSLFFEPALFVVSETYAICIGIPALFVFAFCLHFLVKKCSNPNRLLPWIMIFSLSVTFTATLCAAYHFSPKHFWHAWLLWCIFPSAALLSAFAAVLAYSKSIKAAGQLIPAETNAYYTPE